MVSAQNRQPWCLSAQRPRQDHLRPVAVDRRGIWKSPRPERDGRSGRLSGSLPAPAIPSRNAAPRDLPGASLLVASWSCPCPRSPAISPALGLKTPFCCRWPRWLSTRCSGAGRRRGSALLSVVVSVPMLHGPDLAPLASRSDGLVYLVLSRRRLRLVSDLVVTVSPIPRPPTLPGASNGCAKTPQKFSAPPHWPIAYPTIFISR